MVAWGAALAALSGLAACDTDRDEQKEHEEPASHVPDATTDL